MELRPGPRDQVQDFEGELALFQAFILYNHFLGAIGNRFCRRSYAPTTLSVYLLVLCGRSRWLVQGRQCWRWRNSMQEKPKRRMKLP
jgi:hypothetical protein